MRALFLQSPQVKPQKYGQGLTGKVIARVSLVCLFDSRLTIDDCPRHERGFLLELAVLVPPNADQSSGRSLTPPKAQLCRYLHFGMGTPKHRQQKHRARKLSDGESAQRLKGTDHQKKTRILRFSRKLGFDAVVPAFPDDGFLHSFWPFDASRGCESSMG